MSLNLSNHGRRFISEPINKFLLSNEVKQNSIFLIKSTLQYPKITRFDDENDHSNTSNPTSRLDEEKWTYTTTLFISNTGKYFDSYNLVFNIDKGKNERVVYNITCTKNVPEAKI